jgi:hypothetical protein
VSDTSPEVEARHLAMIRMRPPGGERLKIASAMFDTARQVMIAGIRAARPGISEVELRQELFLRYYGAAFRPEQRDRILAGIAAHRARQEAGAQEPEPPPEPLVTPSEIADVSGEPR